jgi:alanine dehydrogenase
MSSTSSIQKSICDADLVIGAVLIPGARAPKLISNADVATMKAGSVLVDIAIDQGGCFEDSKPTTHENPTYRVHNSIFYCVANMPGAVPVTSTYALTNVTLPFVLQIANRGREKALQLNPDLAKGLNIHSGKVTHKAVAEAHGYEFSPVF